MKYEELSSRLVDHNISSLPKYLKLKNEVVGYVNEDNSVTFKYPKPLIVDVLTNNTITWSPQTFKEFLMDRLPSAHRRDISKILMRARLSVYDPFALAKATRAFSPSDSLWLAYTEDEDFNETLKDVFETIFIKKQDMEGHSVASPPGQNVKRYGVSRGRYGIYKERLHPYSTDAEMEVVVHRLGELLNVKTCSAWMDKEKVFSAFEYDFIDEYIVHVSRLIPHNSSKGSLYKTLIDRLPEFDKEISKMVILDFITRQTDRHLSNFALKVSYQGVTFYPLYDNGRSLFYEDKEELMSKAVDDIELYSSEFGQVGTYFDAIQEIKERYDIRELVNLNVSKDSIIACYNYLTIPDDRLYYGVKWIKACLDYLRR